MYRTFLIKQALVLMPALKPDVQLLPHQERFRDKVKELPENAGILAYHGLGAGKTLASIASGEELEDQPKEVVVPAALRENYRKELDKYVTDAKPYNIKSYDQAVREKKLNPAALTIFDEAHRMGRSGTGLSELPEHAHGKKILLTGSPVRNTPAEIVPLLRALAPDRPVPRSEMEFNTRFIEEREAPLTFLQRLRGVKPGIEVHLKNKDELKKLLEGRVDYHPSSGEFPNTETQDVHVTMSPAQTKLYKGLMETDPILAYKVRWNLPPSKSESQRLNSFMAAVRQVSNNPQAYDATMRGSPVEHSPKMQRMISEIKDRMKADPDFKAVVYSNYLDSGIEPMAGRLMADGVPAAVFSGQLSDTERKRVVTDYNAGKIKALLLSGAGAEGLDLKGTSMIQLMEPHWNEARLQQVIGRGVRHKSHSHLPEEKRKVLIQRYYADPEPTFAERHGLADKTTGADQYLYNRAAEKQQLINEMLDILKDVGSAPAPAKAPAMG